jgi:hypothetical protein
MATSDAPGVYPPRYLAQTAVDAYLLQYWISSASTGSSTASDRNCTSRMLRIISSTLAPSSERLSCNHAPVSPT